MKRDPRALLLSATLLLGCSADLISQYIPDSTRQKTRISVAKWYYLGLRVDLDQH